MGKSISGAKWFGQEQVFSETRGKPAEWDTTKGTKLIIPFLIYSKIIIRKFLGHLELCKIAISGVAFFGQKKVGGRGKQRQLETDETNIIEKT